LYKLSEKQQEIVRYIFIGGLTTAVSFAAYFLFRRIFPQQGTWLPVALSWICAVTFAFVTNKLFVFRSRVRGLRILQEAGLFYAARVVTLLMDLLLMFLLVDLTGFTGGWYELGARVLVSVAVLIMNYVLSKLVVFRKKGEEQQE
jgi:putative flippase GtrA